MWGHRLALAHGVCEVLGLVMAADSLSWPCKERAT